MKLEGKGKLLKIFIGESDRWHGEALYHIILKKAKEFGLAGATIVRGIEGFGANSRVHSALTEVLSHDLPIVIEIIDKEEKINEFIKVIDPMITEGLIVIMHDVEIIKYVKSRN
jgi:PII-like signaling protein